MGETITVDLPVSDRPPKEPKERKAKSGPSGGAPRASATTERRQAPWEKQMEAKLREMLGAIALVTNLKCQYCAGIVLTQADDVSKAWTRLAAENPKVRRVLEALTIGSAYGAVATSTMGMLLPIAMHHNLVPSGILGGSPTPFPAEDTGSGLGNDNVEHSHFDENQNGNGGTPPDNANPLV